MKTFLDTVIQRINDDYDDIATVHIILPSKRSCLYFKDRLIRSGYRSAWLPKIETLSDFIENTYPGKIVNKLTLISLLYGIAKGLKLKEADSFDSFYKWGEVLLSDFNTINSYGIEGNDLYKNLKDIEVLERWSFSGDNWSESQLLFNDFWMKQGDIYQSFIADLEEKNMASSAMALRWILDNKNVLEKLYSSAPIVFAGFNALQKAEQELIDSLLKISKGLFLPDNDAFFISGRREAGYFYRQLSEKYAWKGLKEVEDSFVKEPKEIEIISVNQRSSIGLVNSQLLKDKKSFENTCVVLGDETLLESVLTSLPDEVGALNVTMGYKLRNTPAYDLFVSLYGIQLRMKKKSNEIYHLDLLRFFNHPYIIMLLGERIIRETKSEILKQNLIYISREQIMQIDASKETENFLKHVFISWKNFPNDPSATLLFLIDEISSFVDPEIHPIIIEYLFHLKRATLLLSNHLEKFSIELSLKSYKTLFTEVVNSETLSFHGEPLEGLQLMGLLESRALDFEHVILLSVNEGIIPKTTLSQTFIPWDLRMYYGMPGRKEQDALYSYYFYRLIQRAKKISIVYNTNSGKDLSSVEPSRYIKQLHYYKNQGLIDFTINEYQASLDFSPLPNATLSIKRDAFYHKKLKEKLESSLSPTALSSYLNCPLDFYFKYILRLKESDEVDEEIGADVFGTIIHNTLEELYKPYLGKSPDFKEIRKRMKSEQEKVIKAELKNRWTKTGINRMNIQIIETLLSRFIDLDEKAIKKIVAKGNSFNIEKIEEALSRKIEVDIGNEKVNINLKGLADRIDKAGDTIRIIDYKTGKVDRLNNVEIAKVFEDNKFAKSLQLLMYQAMYDNFESANVDVGIVGFRDLSKYLQSVKLKKGQGDIKSEFYDGLIRLITSMFYDENTIEHNPDSTWCTFCEMH